MNADAGVNAGADPEMSIRRFLNGPFKEAFKQSNPERMFLLFWVLLSPDSRIALLEGKIRSNFLSNFFCKTIPRFTSCYKGFEWHKKVDRILFIVLPFWIHMGQIYFWYLLKTLKLIKVVLAKHCCTSNFNTLVNRFYNWFWVMAIPWQS